MPKLPRKQSKKFTRREFAREAALVTAAAAILPASVVPSAWAAAEAAPAQAAPETKPLSAEAQAEVEAKYQAILRQYGSRLSDTQKKDIHRLLTEGQPSLEKLRGYSLENSNAPATIFFPYRGELPLHRAARKGR